MSTELAPGAHDAAITRFSSTAMTELSPMLTGMPWIDGFQIGAGVDAITGGITGSAIERSAVEEARTKTSSEHYAFVQSQRDLSNEIEVAASGRYNIEGVTVSASVEYLTKVHYSELAVTLIVRYESHCVDYDRPTAVVLTDKARALLADPARFRHAYGDYFVAGGRRASRFTAVYTCQSQTVDQMQDFKSRIGANMPDVFSAEGSARFKQTAASSNVSISTHVFMEGYDGTAPNGPWTPEKVIDALGWFKQHEKGVYLSALLQHYSTIEPSYPRTIDVAPQAFAELRRLYLSVWDVRAQYDSCPRHYQEQLTGEFRTLTTGLEANQATLATDVQERGATQSRADLLGARLKGVFDRLEFYLRVKQAVAGEPAKDHAIEEGTGQQSWPYGYRVWSKSNAVVIHRHDSRYEEKWQIGWREANIGFSDPNAIVVGWEVVSDWGDGTNGQWWKTTDQNLLQDRAWVHVKSQYDRGCAWTIVVSYVDAADYQF
ncbi:hypothetical protein [Conexibacter woesei]|uniref:Uncharacterized protein n=1 Tax=Conexibacter woesei (strain DSM 14684 / CCUG 47730 / CIP 108061 / JCM 11494 / NBRC 100937 / ID131577) TaxID=469383 RepID=D3FDH0_CONWI|nr:hypothetical protein [Conexibacter woesei]ADB49544.1 hypothetical protein Cwoe_1112 [Conexibacter woesei DSM 14684]